MLRFLLPLVLVLPFVDFYILVEVAGQIGFWQTLAAITLTGVIGVSIIKREGIHVLGKLSTSVTGGEISRNMLEGAILVVAGIMLVSPGFITDILGVVLAFRPLRERLVARTMNSSSTTIEVETYRL
jgi:UPF0716 protein FxsA